MSRALYALRTGASLLLVGLGVLYLLAVIGLAGWGLFNLAAAVLNSLQNRF